MITWAWRGRVGTMIEIPRAALLAGEIAKVAEFFSFGTNDLTQVSFPPSPLPIRISDLLPFSRRAGGGLCALARWWVGRGGGG